MKKILMMALVALAVCGASFAKTFVIDVADSTNGTVISIKKNPYAPGHQNEKPADVTPYFANIQPVPGDTIEVHYNFTSNVDLEWLTMAVIDNCEAAKWWGEISNEYKGVGDIKAGVPCSGVITYKVTKKPIKNVTVMFMYDKAIDSVLKLSKSGVKTGLKG